MVLQGYGVTVDLVGTTFISKSGITSTTFKSHSNRQGPQLSPTALRARREGRFRAKFSAGWPVVAGFVPIGDLPPVDAIAVGAYVR